MTTLKGKILAIATVASMAISCIPAISFAGETESSNYDNVDGVIVYYEKGVEAVSDVDNSVIYGTDATKSEKKLLNETTVDNIDTLDQNTSVSLSNGEFISEENEEYGAILKLDVKENDINRTIKELEALDDIKGVEPNYCFKLLEDSSREIYHKLPEETMNQSTGASGIPIDDPDHDETGSMSPLDAAYSHEGCNGNHTRSNHHLKKWDYSLSGKCYCGINAEDAWRYTTGRNVEVAVIDTGVEVTHPNLTGKINTEYMINTVEGDSEKDLSDNINHGTHVAGIIAATPDQEHEVSGVAYNSTILPIKVFDDETRLASSTSVLKALNYIYKLKEDGKAPNLKVINMSFGCYVEEDSLCALGYDYEVNKLKDDYNIISICAGGNEGTNETSIPSDNESTLSVTALDRFGNNADYSDYNKYKDISAPGNIRSLKTQETGSYGYMIGTSMATPVVSSVAAMMYSVDSTMTPEKAVKIMTETANPVSLRENDRTGMTGSVGAVDALAAVQKTKGVELDKEKEDTNPTNPTNPDSQVEPKDPTNPTESTGSTDSNGEDNKDKPGSIEGRTVTLASTSFTYNGNEHKPAVTISGVDSSCYTLTYTNNINAGTGYVIISGINGWTGTVAKPFEIKKAKPEITLSSKQFYYNGKNQSPTVKVNSSGAVTKPATSKLPGSYIITVAETSNYMPASIGYDIKIKPTTISSYKTYVDSISLTVAKQSSTYVTGYQARYSNSADMSSSTSVTIGTKYKSVTKSITKLEPNKDKYFQVRAYKTINSKKYYSDWSAAKSISTLSVKGTSITSSKSYIDGASVTVAKQSSSRVTGYQARYSAYPDMQLSKSVTVGSKYKTVTKKITGLIPATAYYMQVRSYRTVGDTKYYSDWSDTKKVSTSAVKPTSFVSLKPYKQNAFYVKVSKQSSSYVTGYRVKFSVNPDMRSSTIVYVGTKYSTVSRYVKNLAPETTYYVQVQSYRKASGGEYYSTWSPIKSVKTN